MSIPNSLPEPVSAAIAASGLEAADLFDTDDKADEFVSRPFDWARSEGYIAPDQTFGPNCTITISKRLLPKLENGQSKLTIQRLGAAKVDGVRIRIGDFIGYLRFMMSNSSRAYYGNLGRARIDARIGVGGTLVVGDETTSNGTRIIAAKTNVVIGRDVMLSDDILIQGADQHGIFDLETGDFINDKRNITIHRHSWIGRRVTLLPGTVIGRGSIVGACSVVTQPVPECVIAVGSPARVMRENVSWSRKENQLDHNARAFAKDMAAPFLADKREAGDIEDDPFL